MIAITYKLILQEPLLATSLLGDPNSSVSFSYVPGSMIRGLIATRLLAQGDVDLALDERDLLFNGNVRYLNAYPADAQGYRRLPVPISWHYDKRKANEDGYKIVDWAYMDEEERIEADMGEDGFLIPYQAYSDSFVEARVYDRDPSIYNPGRVIHVHHLRDRRIGRPTKDIGAVYQYDALAEGEALVGVILTENQELADRILALLPEQTVRLGGARTAGYGKALLAAVVQQPISWTEVPESDLSDVQPEETFVVTLLSDTILRDLQGRPSQDIAPALPPEIQAEVLQSYQKRIPVGGFNRKWGLPIPQEPALKAGSVFVLKANKRVNKAEFIKWINAGIGERRAEGFGRIAINWYGDDSVLVKAEAHPYIWTESKSNALSAASRNLAQQMQERYQRQMLDRSLAAFLSKFSQKRERLPISKPPANSQLSRLRIFLRDAQRQDDLTRIYNLLSPTILDAEGKEIRNPQALKSRSMEQFRKARLNVEGVPNERLDGWMRALIEDTLSENPQTIWNYLDSDKQIIGNNNLLLDVEAKPSDLSIDYTFRLIDGILEAAMRTNRATDGDDGGNNNG
ncbi:MAG: hypothetical protein KDD92_04450 [Caldilineaceae bacterium]|nr:hypothetical protein [Caldilineaceae bacterium]